MKTASEFMIEMPVIKAGDTVTRARKILRDEGFRELYVQDGKKKLIGVIDITDVLRVHATRSNVTVEGFVRDAAITGPGDKIERVATVIRQFRTDSAAVLDEAGRFLGGVLLSNIFPVIVSRNELSGTVTGVMSRKPVTCTPEDSIQKLHTLIIDSGFSGFPVIVKGRLAGVVTRRDLLKEGRLRTALEQNAVVHAGDIMTKEVLTVEESTPLSRAAELMAEHDISFLPVVADHRVTGVVDRHDVLKGIRFA
jgi:CBS domain-containing protein